MVKKEIRSGNKPPAVLSADSKAGADSKKAAAHRSGQKSSNAAAATGKHNGGAAKTAKAGKTSRTISKKSHASKPTPKKPFRQDDAAPSALADDDMADMGIVIVDDTIEIDREKINEERRAYLEEARSQEAFD